MFDVFKYTPFQENAYSKAGTQNAVDLKTYGGHPQARALTNLYQLLLGQGRVDPRLLATAQAANARATQQQQNAARTGAAAGGMGRGGLQSALMAAIGSAGANRAANLNYQDIADSYARNQANIGLTNQVVTQPSLGYAQLGNQLGLGMQASKNDLKSGWLGFAGGLLNSAGTGIKGG